MTNNALIFRFMEPVYTRLGRVSDTALRVVAGGLLTRVSAGAIAVLLVVALPVHLPNGAIWTDGGFEYPLFWLVVVLTFWVKGGGEYSLDRLIGREF